MELLSQIAHYATQFIDVILHLDAHLNEWVRLFGPSIYAVLFAVVFCETGLVITPFLPGDSLLFALGALSAGDNPALSLPLLVISLMIAAVLGDAVNYAVGLIVGPKIFRSEQSVFLNKKHLIKTQEFYNLYGGKTIIIARFIPIIRTFAPFVAGIGRMAYGRFALFNILGGVTWVGLFLGVGHLFGNLPSVKRNFHLVIFAILILSILPPLYEWLRTRTRAGVRHRVV